MANNRRRIFLERFRIRYQALLNIEQKPEATAEDKIILGGIMLNGAAECLQVKEITLKILYDHGQKPKIKKHMQKKMLNITTLLHRNSQRKKVE